MNDTLEKGLTRTDLPLANRREGKVRDLYDLPGDSAQGPGPLLIVATDRISAFDVVMPTPIPGKGRMLTAISNRWFDFITERGLTATHRISSDAQAIQGISDEERGRLDGRITICRRCRVVPVECVVRGYLAGSGWVEYQQSGAVCGVPLPPGLRNGDALPQPIFTPATKAELGAHDENIDFDRACAIAGKDVMERLRAMSLSIYAAAHAQALDRGVIIADTKFEFGFPLDDPDSPPILVDEALTPDSSRFWRLSAWAPGKEQDPFDKQYVRNYLLSLVSEGKWNKQAPGPALPTQIVRDTMERYREAAEMLFGADVNMEHAMRAGR